VSIMRLRIRGWSLNLEEITGLVILTCHHLEEGKVPSSMAGSQDALLPTPIGHQMNQTIGVTMKIMLLFMTMEMADGTMNPLKRAPDVAVSTP